MTTFLLPNTLDISKSNAPDSALDDTTSTNACPSDHRSSTFKESLRRIHEGLLEIRSFLRTHGVVSIVMLAYVIVAVSKVVQLMLLQYTTKRYDWSWSKVSIIKQDAR